MLWGFVSFVIVYFQQNKSIEIYESLTTFILHFVLILAFKSSFLLLKKLNAYFISKSSERYYSKNIEKASKLTSIFFKCAFKIRNS